MVTSPSEFVVIYYDLVTYLLLYSDFKDDNMVSGVLGTV